MIKSLNELANRSLLFLDLDANLCGEAIPQVPIQFFLAVRKWIEDKGPVVLFTRETTSFAANWLNIFDFSTLFRPFHARDFFLACEHGAIVNGFDSGFTKLEFVHSMRLPYGDLIEAEVGHALEHKSFLGYLRSEPQFVVHVDFEEDSCFKAFAVLDNILSNHSCTDVETVKFQNACIFKHRRASKHGVFNVLQLRRYASEVKRMIEFNGTIDEFIYHIGRNSNACGLEAIRKEGKPVIDFGFGARSNRISGDFEYFDVLNENPAHGED